METQISNNKLSFATQKINITYSIAPALERNRLGACCRAILRTILFTILQIILSTSFIRGRRHYPRGEDGLSLVLQRLVLYQKGNRRRKQRKVGLNSPPRPSPWVSEKTASFSTKRTVENALCCVNNGRVCV